MSESFWLLPFDRVVRWARYLWYSLLETIMSMHLMMIMMNDADWSTGCNFYQTPQFLPLILLREMGGEWSTWYNIRWESIEHPSMGLNGTWVLPHWSLHNYYTFIFGILRITGTTIRGPVCVHNHHACTSVYRLSSLHEKKGM